MREIKFRGMDIHGDWHYGLICKIKGHTYISNSFGMPKAYDVRPETVGQYIGIKDNNCKEIYEGDIVQYFRLTKAVGTIIYNNEEDGGGGFMPQFLNDEGHIWYEKERWYNLEVIGSISKNPELLE